MNNNVLLTSLSGVALLLIASCTAPSGAPDDKMAEHLAMMKADSAAKATAETAKECMRKVFTMFETGNSDGIEGCVAENIIEHSPPPPGITTTGLQALKDVIAMHHGAFPDTKMTILSMAVDGDIIYAHYNMKGTNTGGMGPDMPATNKVMDVNGVDIVRFENGKGVEHWGYWEESKMMEQMGMMPPPGEGDKMAGKEKGK